MKNKKGLTSEALVLILMVLVLAAVSIIYILWGREGAGLIERLNALFLL